jgi:hypothetical protein
MWVLFTSMCLFIIASIYFRQKVYNHLRAEHPATWKELGEPSLLVFRGPREATGPQLYFWRREYAGLDDSALNRLVAIMKGMEAAGYTLFSLSALACAFLISR